MRKSVVYFWRFMLVGTIACILFIACIFFGLFGDMPSLAELENPTLLQATEIYAEDGTVMGKFFKENGNRSNVKYNDISKHAVNALIATEDKRFKEHSGIDPKGVARAVGNLARDGGGSTITQQLAKNLLDQGSRNFLLRIVEKIKEWIIAIKLERNFTKEEIANLYLNAVAYSENMYGIRNASITFFQKEPDRLNIEEAAMLIGMVNAPTLYNPRRNPKGAMNRRNLVISRMVESGFLTEEEAAKAKAKPIDLSRYRKQDENNGLAPYFREHLREEIKTWCKKHKNPITKEPYNIYRDGLRIFTTINPRMQLYAEEALVKHMPTLQKDMNSQLAIKTGKVWKGKENVLEAAMKASERWKSMKEEDIPEEEIKKTFYKKTEMKVFAWNAKREKDTIMTPFDSIKYHRQLMQTSFMVLDPGTGEVKAWVGGIDFKNFKFDHVNLETKRQVGSSIKPFLYCEAIEELNFGPETPVQDEQQVFPDYGNGLVPATTKSCKGGTFSLSTALTYSKNCATAYIMKQVTPKRFSEFIKQINIPTKVPALPSMCLGSCELSMFEMLWGYTMFANRGINTKPIYITRIEDKNGNVLESFQTPMKQVISEPGAYTMTRLLGGPVEVGTAKGLRQRLGAVEMGGKTGTTNDNSDAWFIGFTPQLLAGAWVGCDDRFIRLETATGMGGQAAMPIWEYFFKKVYEDKTLGIDKNAKFHKPDNMNEQQGASYNPKTDTLPPGAQSDDRGNGPATDYDEYKSDTSHIPTDSKLNADEQKIKQEAGGTKKDEKSSSDKPSSKLPAKDSAKVLPKKEEEKKKKTLLDKLFGGKDKKD
jgi:penicillin-binding protein 1A